MKNYLLFSLGWFFMGLGILGIYLPIMPGVFFLIISALCFMKASPKYYNMIINNRQYGHYIKDYIENNVIPYKIKRIILMFIWSCSMFSIFFILYDKILIYRVIVLIIAIFSSLIILKANN